MINSVEKLIENIEKVIVGKREVVEKLIVALLNNGHIILEDVPGVGKTQLVSALAKSVNADFNRIQLTPDIMPSDVVGFSMINPATRELEYRKGVVMCNFLLADEINRASPKTQSSLLEVMEEYQVTVDQYTYQVPKPFMVLATQNPVESYGTYQLPEAQMDRFMMKVSLGYPTREEEKQILSRTENGNPITAISQILNVQDIIEMQEGVKRVCIVEKLKNYIITIANATRESEYVKLGVSPRGSITLMKAAKARAYIKGRDFVTPEDILELASEVLSHRVLLNPRGKSIYQTSKNLIKEILGSIAVPME